MFTYKKENQLPIKSWIPEDQYYADEKMVEQVENLAKLPFAFSHIVLSPDGHVGFGMPIGGVLATQDVIIPNCVGADIGAVDKKTEVLTKNGWITIDKYQNEEVLIWDNYKETAFFSKPLLYIVKPCENFTEYKSKHGLDQVLSDEHRMLVYDGYGKNKKNNTYFCRDFREKILKLKKQDYYSIRTTFPTSELGINLTDEQIAIKVMISADGHIRKFGKKYTLVELHLKKLRKIIRSKNLLKQAMVNFKEYKHKDKTVSITFKLNWYCNKDLTSFFCCNQHQAKVIFNEYLYWDGTIDKKRNHKTYSSIDKKNADVIQYICALNDVRAGIYCSFSKNNKWKDCYSVYQTQNTYVGFNKPRKIKTIGENKYCFVVETGYFIARRNNKIFITGNCGMCAVKTSLTDISQETLKKIMGEIRKVIPVGFNHHKEKQDEELMPIDDNWLNDNWLNSMPIVKQEYQKAQFQIGTLGGGNHFISIEKGSDDHIWIMIHSGSRNIGFQVANYYNKLAIELNEKWHTSVPKEWELAFLPVDSREGQNYINEMNYCVDFALANRKLMMDRIMNILTEIFYDNRYLDKIQPEFEPMINIAHNYAKLENHFGHNVWVHRKGATKAYEGKIGIIPGSMGTSSYIVKGLGNKESFMSCSHGAGRKMGRKEAIRTLNLKEEQKKMKGILGKPRNQQDLEEAPGAYKDVKEVMRNQKDLVKILVKLRPLAVIKG